MKIYVIFTGGTIGSSVNDGWISPDSTTKKQLIENYKQKFGNEIDFVISEPYSILSENLDAKNLNNLINEVRNGISQDFDGVIVTHGTDTLQYTATALSFALGNSCIPVFLVSSNYPISDERANGNINFEAAVEFIKQAYGNGVFVTYRNFDNRTYIHAGINLLTHLEADDNLYSLNNNYYAEYTDGKIIVHRQFVDCRPAEADSTHLTKEPKILVIDSIPSDVFNYDISDCNGVIIRPYHSGTLNTDNKKLQAFFQKAFEQNIPVYVSSVASGTAYESCKAFEKLKIRTLPNSTFTDIYIKLWFETSKN